MSVLEQLGLNSTAFVQFAIFVVSILILTKIAYTPYYEALVGREKSTVGGEKLAEEMQQKAKDLHLNFETEAKKINNEIKTIFDSYRDQANKEYSEILSGARNEAQRLLDETRLRVSAEASQAATVIKDQAASVAAEITNKMLSR